MRRAFANPAKRSTSGMVFVTAQAVLAVTMILVFRSKCNLETRGRTKIVILAEPI